MNFIGPWINAVAIMLGGGIGSMIGGGKLSKMKYRDTLTLCCGLAVIGIGILGIWDSFFVLEDKKLETTGTVLVFVSLLIGWLLGEAFAIDRAIRKAGEWLFCKFVAEETVAKNKTPQHKGKNNHAGPKILFHKSSQGFSQGFLIAVMVVCTSHLAIFGITEGSQGNLLYIKSAVDFALSVALSMIYGVGVAFAAIAVLIGELGLAALHTWGESLLTETVIRQLACIGSCMMLVTGFNLTFGKKFKVGNLLPSFLIPLLYYWILTVSTNAAGA